MKHDSPSNLDTNTPSAIGAMRSCRCCGAALQTTFADLGMTPMANSFVSPERAERMEPFYPLCAYVCETCHLVQLAAFESPQAIFGDYVYFSSFSESWLRHAKDYVRSPRRASHSVRTRWSSRVASNDGYLLQYFKAREFPFSASTRLPMWRRPWPRVSRPRWPSSVPRPHNRCARRASDRT